MPGATWKLSTGQQRVPIQLRRQELNPIARRWHQFSIHSLIPSSNRSEIPVIRAILIHCIMKGEDVRAEDIIADKIVKMAQGIKEKGKLGFPSTIYKLCKEAGPEYEHYQDFQEEPQVQQPPLYHVPTYIDQHEKDLHSIETQLQNMMWYQQQTLENISKSQAEYMAELREIKGKQQELYENNDRFYNQVREEQREMAKEIQQVKNYQVNQTMVDSARNKAIFDELAAERSRQEEFFSNHANQYNMIRQKQKLLVKEILDVKKYQINAVTMGSGSSSSPTPQRYEPDQALMKIREQHANFSEMQRQLKDWTRNASARECYTQLELENSGLLIEKLTLKSLLIDKTVRVKSKERERRTSKNFEKEKNEERKLAEQETKFGSNSGEEFHAYAWITTLANMDPRLDVLLGVAPLFLLKSSRAHVQTHA
ncbi:hypothetical protein PIB30_076396 [Stylosanthes scabra]|uniref:Putative plant transposon protein domain-containing protein n=1 Tax=Stylosanthes scabra TaxID=79078 RepID=A0ABU6ZP05_9FABA|nr:hypothetical protein [Stylosanthes scabra]